jgi:hypothetical protein
LDAMRFDRGIRTTAVQPVPVPVPVRMPAACELAEEECRGVMCNRSPTSGPYVNVGLDQPAPGSGCGNLRGKLGLLPLMGHNQIGPNVFRTYPEDTYSDTRRIRNTPPPPLGYPPTGPPPPANFFPLFHPPGPPSPLEDAPPPPLTGKGACGGKVVRWGDVVRASLSIEKENTSTKN